MAAYTLRQLRYFVTAVEQGSVAEASRQLAIAQPSISAAIKDIEHSFNVQLFIRHPAQGMSLTPTGARFYQRAKDLLRHAYTFEQNALADKQRVQGEIDVGCYETTAPLHLPRILAHFATHYPDVKVRVHDGEQHALIAGLDSGRFDVAVLFRHGLSEAFEVVSLMPPQQPYVLLPQHHPLAAMDAVSLHALAQEPMIQLDVQPSSSYFASVFSEHGLCPEIAYRSPSIEMVRGLVGQGLGFSLLVTRPLSDTSYDGMPLVTRPLQEPGTGSELAIAWLRRSPLTTPAALFVAQCKDVFSCPESINKVASNAPFAAQNAPLI
jgi:DNA-binding transcriptional LysR family regulator